MSDVLHTIIVIALGILLIVLIMRGRERNHYIYAIPIAIILMLFGNGSNYSFSDTPFYIILLLTIFNYISAVIAFRVANAYTEGSYTYFILFDIIVGVMQYLLLLLFKSVLI